MKNKKSESENENNPKTTPTRALLNLMEKFEHQTRRINIMEQQVLDLSARLSGIEDSKVKSRYF